MRAEFDVAFNKMDFTAALLTKAVSKLDRVDTAIQYK
jgi:hypothetical protein